MLVQEEGASMLGASAGSCVMHFYRKVVDMRWSSLRDREKMQVLSRGGKRAD